MSRSGDNIHISQYDNIDTPSNYNNHHETDNALKSLDVDLKTNDNSIETSNPELNLLDTAIQQMQNLGYPDRIISQFLKCQRDATHWKNLDHELLELLKDLYLEDKLVQYEKHQYSEIINNIDEGSYVIYFKNAEVFKVYSPKNIDTLTNHMNTRTILKKTQDVYEIVDKNHPQKIIIIIDGSVKAELTKIRNYVFMFFSKYDDLLNRKDIITFQDPVTNNLEILINGLYVKNYENKENFVKKLVQYIETEERKLGSDASFDIEKIKNWRYCEIPGAEMYRIPQRKQNLDSDKMNHVSEYVANVQNCRLLGNTVHIIINNGTIGNIGNNNTNNHHGNNTITTESNIEELEDVESCDEIQEFVKHIRDTHPTWYKPGKWMYTKDLYSQFVKLCGSEISKDKFSKNSINVLFSKRGNIKVKNIQGRAVLLLPYTKL